MTNSILLFYLGGICDRVLVISGFLLGVSIIVLLAFICLSFGSTPECTDAEQVAYRIWERQVAEEGWDDISIYRTLVDVPKHPMTGKEVA